MLSLTKKHNLVCFENPRSPVSDAYRSIQMNIDIRSESRDKPLKTILVTSSGPKDGKTTMAGNLAVAYAQTGKKVLLIDGNLRKPDMNQCFLIPSGLGFSDLLSRHYDDVSEAINDTVIPNLSLLQAGEIPFNPSELLITRAGKVLDQLSGLYDLIIVDSSSILETVDSQILASACEAVLVVIRKGRTKREWLEKAMDHLHSIRANVLGLAFNGR